MFTHEKLVNILKLGMVQAYRGEMSDYRFYEIAVDSNHADMNLKAQSSLCDITVFHSSTEQYQSYRRPQSSRNLNKKVSKIA